MTSVVRGNLLVVSERFEVALDIGLILVSSLSGLLLINIYLCQTKNLFENPQNTVNEKYQKMMKLIFRLIVMVIKSSKMFLSSQIQID